LIKYDSYEYGITFPIEHYPYNRLQILSQEVEMDTLGFYDWFNEEERVNFTIQFYYWINHGIDIDAIDFGLNLNEINLDNNIFINHDTENEIRSIHTTISNFTSNDEEEEEEE
jgi:hypothetical protein